MLVALVRPKGGSSAGSMVRFSWGSFLFTGYIESLGETIELFSSDGVPLRATITLSMKDLAGRDSRPDSAAGFGLGASAGISADVSGGIGGSAGASFGASAGVSGGIGASAGGPVGGGLGAFAGASATPLTLTAAGDTVQSLAARAGVSWRAIAEANGIDNPRLLPPGTVLDLRIGTT